MKSLSLTFSFLIIVLTGLFTYTNCDNQLDIEHNGVGLGGADGEEYNQLLVSRDNQYSPYLNEIETRATPTTPNPAGSTVLCGPQNANVICAPGLCCSSYGNCGVGDLYCSSGCQSKFGQCGSITSSSMKPGPTGSTTTCGPNNQNAICADGYSCSSKGFCGKGPTYSADPACQFKFGICDSNLIPAGRSTQTDPRPPLGDLTYSKDIFHCTKPNVVAFTYDDGPLNYTIGILDLLKQYGFHATFFICGNNLGKGSIDVTAPYPDLIRRMINEGHQVASHTFSHYNLDDLTTTQRNDQLVKNERVIANILGFYPTYLRPPYSGCQTSTGCQTDVSALGYHRVYFDFDTDDYLNDSPTLIQRSKDMIDLNLKKLVDGKDILSIQHDINRQGANLTDYYFKLIVSKGWKGVTVGECLQDDPVNWYRVPGTGNAVNNAAAAAASASTNNPTSGTSTGSLSSSSSKSKAIKNDIRSSISLICFCLAILAWLQT